MIIVSYRSSLSISTWTLAPRARYVVSNGFYNRRLAELTQKGLSDQVLSSSSISDYERRYAGHDLNGKSLLIYRECGIGDHLFVTALTAFLKHLYPQAYIAVHGFGGSAPSWKYSQHADFVGQPPTFDALRRFDYHLMLENMLESDNEQEQPNCYDALFQFAGFDPRKVPAEFKRPSLFLGPEDHAVYELWKQAMPERYILWHWNPSGRVRMYPKDLSVQAINELANHVDVVMVGDSTGEDAPPVFDSPRIHSYVGQTKEWRHLLPMIQHSQLVICPDSSVLHAAATMRKPTLGLWGSFGPQDRALYYPKHKAISGASSCPYAPCRAQFDKLPVQMCQSAEGWTPEERYCRAMYISSDRIVEEALKVLG